VIGLYKTVIINATDSLETLEKFIKLIVFFHDHV